MVGEKGEDGFRRLWAADKPEKVEMGQMQPSCSASSSWDWPRSGAAGLSQQARMYVLRRYPGEPGLAGGGDRESAATFRAFFFSF